MATRVIEIPLNGGQNEGVDRTLLEPGELRALLDGRLTRDGRIEVRPGYTSLGRATVNTLNGRYYAYDIATFQDNLIGIGTIDSVSFTPAYPRQLFTYVGSQGWAPQVDSQFDQLSPVSDLRILYQAPYGNTTSTSDTAWTNGFLCVCTADSIAQNGTVYILDTATGAVVKTLRTTSGLISSRCIAVGNLFVVVLRNSAGDLVGQTIDTTDLDTGFSAPSTFISALLGDTFSWDLVPLGGTSNFMVSFSDSATSNMRLRSYTTAFAAVNAVAIAATNGDSAVIGDTTHGVVWAILVGNNVVLRTLTTALVVTVGPTNVLGPAAVSTSGTGNVTNQPALGFVSATAVTVQADNAGTLGISDSVFTTRSLAAHAESVGGRNGNVRISTKLYQHERSSSLSGNFGVGTLITSGNIVNTQQSYANCIQGIENSYMCAARWNYGVADKLINPSNKVSRHGRATISTNGSGTFWASVAVLDESGVGTPNRGTLQIVQFKAGVAQRKQTAEMQGALYIAGGFAYYYDRGTVPAEAGFLDTPVINNLTPSTAAGTLTLSSTYNYVAVYEWQDAQGRLHRSTPSTPRAVTLIGANNTVTAELSTPRSVRRTSVGTTTNDSNGVKVVLYRAANNDSVFFRVGDTTASASGNYADVASIVDTLSDASAEIRPVLYTQSQKPTVNVGWQPCRFISAGRDRIIRGGLPDPYLVELTQLAFPAEPMEGASPNNFAFQARLPEVVTGVACPGDSYIAFTTAGVYEIPGEGPQRNGTGEFFTPRAIFTDAGCIDWRSIVETGKGTFFQADTDKLFLLGLDGNATWVGQPIRDTLALYPNIVGSCLCSSTQLVVFACNNSATNPTDGVLLIFDLRRGIWYVDRIGTGIRAVTEYLGRLAYVLTDGLVYLENASIGLGGTMPTLSARSGDYRLFSAMGQGDVCKIGLLGTYVGDSTVEGFISYDDGKTWTSMGQFSVTTTNTKLGNPVSGAALSSGDPVSLIFTPKKRNIDRFSLRFDCSNGTDTGGMRMHVVSLEVEAQEFTTRKGSGSQK